MIDIVTLNHLHSTELEILDEFAHICNKHNLTYFLVGGTLLGAVRHKGFIPWDDDIDVGMPRSDFNKFIDIYKKKKSSSFYIKSYKTNKGYYFPFAKLLKKNTVLIENNVLYYDREESNGIYIDIFPYDNTINIQFIHSIQNIIVKKIIGMICLKINLLHNIKKSPVKNFIVGLFSFNFLQCFMQGAISFFSLFNTKYLISLGGRYGVKKEVFMKKYFIPVSSMQFEGKFYAAPGKPEIYLSQIYGSDYMDLPPMEKRINHNPVKIVF
jgi:lipopolysaccharide cholinephosphotransferase